MLRSQFSPELVIRVCVLFIAGLLLAGVAVCLAPWAGFLKVMAVCLVIISAYASVVATMHYILFGEWRDGAL